MEKSNANMVKLRVMEVADAGVRSGSASTAMLIAERERRQRSKLGPKVLTVSSLYDL